jgi:hypothetical protein
MYLFVLINATVQSAASVLRRALVLRPFSGKPRSGNRRRITVLCGFQDCLFPDPHAMAWAKTPRFRCLHGGFLCASFAKLLVDV